MYFYAVAEGCFRGRRARRDGLSGERLVDGFVLWMRRLAAVRYSFLVRKIIIENEEIFTDSDVGGGVHGRLFL